jgi:branched-subunit amino acid ABC-type transport system permease component
VVQYRPTTAEVLLPGIVSGLLMGLVYALIAAGLSLIFGLMEIVNFAHGEFLMLAMFTSYWAWALWRWPTARSPSRWAGASWSE